MKNNQEYNFLKSDFEKKEISNRHRKEYTDWINENSKNKKPFFALNTDFESFLLKNISGGALKLYIYLGFRAKYYTGELWESIPAIAEYFEKDVRTVANWFSELESIGLISRYQFGFKRSANTFLNPYGINLHFYPEISKQNEATDYSMLEEFLNIFFQTNSKAIDEILVFNYAFQEFTLICMHQKTPLLLDCYVLLNFQIEDGKKLLKIVNKYGIKTRSMYDIEVEIISDNIKNNLYRTINEYLRYEKN